MPEDEQVPAEERVRDAPEADAADAAPVPTTPADVAARLGELATEEQGAAYLQEQQLAREDLLAVASELGMTRVDRLSNAKLQERVLNQAISTRNRFAGLREGWQERHDPAVTPSARVPQDVIESPAEEPPERADAPADLAPTAAAGDASTPTTPETTTQPAVERPDTAQNPATEQSAASAIATHLRETATTEQGSAYLKDQELDRETLLAVAGELGITRVDRLSNAKLQERVLNQAISTRDKFAGLREGWQKQRDPAAAPMADAPAAPTPVAGMPSAAPLLPNAWGDPTKKDINFHDDGQIGSAIKNMGEDARMDVDGEPVANVLGRVATDVVTGRRTAAEGVEAYKKIRDRLPEGGPARQSLDVAITRIDAPPSAPPAVPAGAPEPLKALMNDLHSIPLLRRDPRETEKLQEILRENFDDAPDDGPIHLRRFARDLRELKGLRHEMEGDAGKFDVERAIEKAINALDGKSGP
ncbi:hypothetical protein OG439_32640 [Amycolatopsis sp. NBC_01307]|uniref:hypothetical protein n=1 Tax=Amycolatopsis sp. NBC_01307 TaxID=2903561 RepID=UPI002E10AB35|nr:hypothetical protein OG439_32640 [Amycolatopsis sp. NBC_01307]